MGLLKKVEQSIKRTSMRVTTSLVRSPKHSAEEIMASRPRRILVVRQQNQMGDMLLAVPAFRAIAERLPDARITVLSAPINRDVLRNNPYVEDVLTFDKVNPFTNLSLLRRIRRRRYDLVIVLQTVSFSFTSALLGLLSGARYRVGSTSQPWGNSLGRSFYHLELPLPTADELATMNEAEHNLYPLRAMGISTDNLAPMLVPDGASDAFAAEFLAMEKTKGRRTVVIHPGAGKVENVWGADRFAGVANRLLDSEDCYIVAVQGPRDAETVAEFTDSVIGETVPLRGRPIADVAAVLKRADLVLCNDTGVMHVAAATGAYTLAVFGPTDPHRWAPRCDNLHVIRGEGGDLLSLSVDDVYARAIELLEEVRAS